MNAGDDLADAGLDAGLLPQICDVFPSFADDNASVFCAHERAQGEGVVGGGRRGARVRGRLWKAVKKFSRTRAGAHGPGSRRGEDSEAIAGGDEEERAGSEEEIVVAVEKRLLCVGHLLAPLSISDTPEL